MVKIIERVLLLSILWAAGLIQVHASTPVPSTVRAAIRQALAQADAVAVSAILKQHGLTATSELNPNGETLLHMIAIGSVENLDLYEALTNTEAEDSPIDFDVTDKQGSTALHNAAITNKRNLVGKLLASGAKTDITDNQGETARQIAEQGGYTEIVELIDEHDAALAAAEAEPLGVGAADGEVDLSLILISMTDMAEKGAFDPLIGRAPELTRILEILGRRKKNNPVLVGLAGTGKTAIIEGLATLVASGNVPDELQDKTIYSLNVSALLATGPDMPVYVQALLAFAHDNPDAVFFADEVHGLARNVGGVIPIDMMKPSLASGTLRLIGATTEDEYLQHIASDATLARRVMRVSINEPSLELAALIAMSARDLIAEHHGVKITNTAVYSAVTLSAQYLTDRTLPDKAIDLLDEAASAVRQGLSMRDLQRQDLETQIKAKEVSREIGTYTNEVKEELKQLRAELKKFNSLSPKKEVNTRVIGELIAQKTGISVEKVLQDRHEKVLALFDNMAKQVFGQDHALKLIQEVLIASHAGLTDGNKPLGSFLLGGSTGTGKTETAKRLAENLFDDVANLIVLDMSEYSHSHEKAKLIGSPPGYVGYDDGGGLTDKVRHRPYSVVLFDEIEKAHPTIAHIMLQMLDEGRLTDGHGNTVDFSNTVIMMTTNSPDIEEAFPPEFIGRIDEVITYNNLDRSIMEKLVQKNIDQINQRLFNKGVTVSLDDQTIKYLGRKGYDPKYGARPLETVFHRAISVPLSLMIVEGKLAKGKHYTLSLDEEGKLQATQTKKGE